MYTIVAMDGASSLTNICPRVGDAGRKSAMTSWMRPEVQRTIFASAFGARWKCMPRTLPRTRVSELLPWTGRKSMPCAAKLSAHQVRMKLPRSSTRGVNSISRASESPRLTNFMAQNPHRRISQGAWESIAQDNITISDLVLLHRSRLRHTRQLVDQIVSCDGFGIVWRDRLVRQPFKVCHPQEITQGGPCRLRILIDRPTLVVHVIDVNRAKIDTEPR